MEDPETGTMPRAGAQRVEAPGPIVPRNGGVAGPDAAGRTAQPDRAAGAASEGASQPAPKRKRKRRKRGRGVYVRGGPAEAAIPVAEPAIVDERPGTGPQTHPRQPLPPGHGATRHRAGTLRQLPAYAALDLGTNNCRLLVAVPTRPGQFRVIDAFSRIVRLGEGLSASGRLSDEAMDRAVGALKICADKLRTRPIAATRLIATEACRAAGNGEAFLARVAAETGLELEVIDRETEARLAVSGCGSLVERETDAVVLFDIGGGSSEIALVDVSAGRSPQLARHIVAWTSLPVGVVSLAEKFGGRDVTAGIFADMVAHVRAMIDRFEDRHRLGERAAGERFHLLGTSGTVTTLAGVHLELERYDRRQVDGLWMADRDVDAMIQRLLGWDFDQRVANPCIGADRADLVLAGCAILQAIRDVWPAPRLRVADRGLREGILSELMSTDGAWRRRGRHQGAGR